MLGTVGPRAYKPYRASFGSVRVDDGSGQRVPFLGEVTCGHNPWLRARLVDRLRRATGEYPDGSPALKLVERPRRESIGGPVDTEVFARHVRPPSDI